MKIVFGLVFIVTVLLIFLRWVLKMGRFGFMMIGMTICVPAAMGCALDLHGNQRYWAIAPTAAFLALVVLLFREWNRLIKP